MKWAVVLYWI